MKRTTFLAATLLFLMATPALAHTDQLQTSSLTAGLLHPFLGLDHMLAMIAVGLLAVQKGGKASIALPALFITLLLVGGILGISALAIPFVEQGILGSVIILGAVIAAGHRISSVTAGFLVGFFALFHGVSHGMEIPAGASSVVYVTGFATATLALHALGFMIGKTMPIMVSEKFVSNAFRITGLSVALAGLGLAAV